MLYLFWLFLIADAFVKRTPGPPPFSSMNSMPCGGINFLVVCLLSSLRFLSYKFGLGPHFNPKIVEMLEDFGELLIATF